MPQPAVALAVPTASTLETALRQELALLEALHELLAAERRALIQRDVAGISSLAADKRRALESLTTASASTRALWTAHHQATGVSAVAGPPSPATALLESVRTAWRRAERANQCNSAVLKLHQASVLRGLAVLRQALGTTDLYRADGRAGGHYLSS